MGLPACPSPYVFFLSKKALSNIATKNNEMHGSELQMPFTKRAVSSSYSYGTLVEFRIRICSLQAFFRFLLRRFITELPMLSPLEDYSSPILIFLDESSWTHLSTYTIARLSTRAEPKVISITPLLMQHLSFKTSTVKQSQNGSPLQV